MRSRRFVSKEKTCIATVCSDKADDLEQIQQLQDPSYAGGVTRGPKVHN